MNEQEQQPRYTLRGKKWVFGATLVAAGLAAGSGATYAVTSGSSPEQNQVVGQRGGPPGPDGAGGGELGAPPSTQPG